MNILRRILSHLLGLDQVHVRLANGRIVVLYGIDSWGLELSPVPGRPEHWRLYDRSGALVTTFRKEEVLSIKRRITSN